MLNEATSGVGNVNTTVSLANATGVTEVWADRVTDSDGGTDDGVGFAGVSKAVQLGIVSGDTTVAGLNRANVTFTLNDVTGTADAASLVLDSASVNNVVIGDVETLNIKGQTTSSRIDGTLTATAATNLVFTGDKDIRIDATDIDAANSYTVDASAFTGKLNITLEDQAPGKKTTVTGGTGDDKIYLGTGLDVNDSINGGAGTNTIGFTQAADLTATTGALLKNFQIFDANGAAGAFDMDMITGGGTASTITGLSVSGTLGGGGATINNLAAGAAVTIGASTGAAALTVNVKGAADAGSNSDTLSYQLTSSTADITVASLVAANVETINIESKATSGITTGHTIAASTFANATTINFTGDEQLTFTAVGAVAATKIDASAMTDKFVMTNASTAATTLLLKGGSAADTLRVDDAVQKAGTTIIGNGGADTISIATGGVQTNLKYLAQSDSTAGAFDHVTGFVTTEDKLDVSAFAFTGAAKLVFDATAKVSFTGTGATGQFAITDANAAGFFTNTGANRGVAIADNGTDTFVLIDVNHDGNWNASTDSVVQLLGVTGGAAPVTGDITWA